MEIIKPTLSVATLNYTGVMTSPYQYYQEESIKSDDPRTKKINQILSQKFQEKLKSRLDIYKKKSHIINQKFDWNMGTLDTIWKTRYSPFNLPTAGLIITIKDGKQYVSVLTEEQFLKKWDQIKEKDKSQNAALKQYIQLNKKYSKQEALQQIENCRDFDLLCHLTLAQVYGKNYKQRQELQFNKPYLKQDLKIQKTFAFIKNTKPDILFFQQSSDRLQQKLVTNLSQSYHLVKNSIGKSIIITSKSTFSSSELNGNKLQENKNKFLKEYMKKLSLPCEDEAEIKKMEQKFNVNNDSVFVVIGHFVFWNVHLSSKQENNVKQLQAVANFLNSLKKQMPAYHYCLGGDFNTTIDKQFALNFQYSNSNSKNLSTVKKKRTRMQPQVKKADKNDFSAKDYFFSNLKLQSSQIKMLNEQGKEAIVDDKALLPNSNHPYDHYVVKVLYDVPLSIKVIKI